MLIRRLKIGVLIVLGVVLAVFSLGRLKNNRLLEKAEELKKEADKSYHETTGREQERASQREKEADESKSRKESLDDRLKSLKDSIRDNSSKILIFMIIILLFTPNLVMAESALPDSYEEMKALYFNVLDDLVAVRMQRDEAISIAEDYKKEYEILEGILERSEASIEEYDKQLRNLHEIIDKQSEIIRELSRSSRLGIVGGVTYSFDRPGVFTGLVFDF